MKFTTVAATTALVCAAGAYAYSKEDLMKITETAKDGKITLKAGEAAKVSASAEIQKLIGELLKDGKLVDDHDAKLKVITEKIADEQLVALKALIATRKAKPEDVTEAELKSVGLPKDKFIELSKRPDAELTRDALLKAQAVSGGILGHLYDYMYWYLAAGVVLSACAVAGIYYMRKDDSDKPEF